MTLWDAGAQPERTALAWTRTVLALIAAGLLGVEAAPSAPGVVLAAAVVCGGAALQIRRTMRHYDRRVPKLTAGDPVTDPASVLIVTASTVALGAVAVLIALG